MTAVLDVGACRARFPALDLRFGGRPAAYLDGPAGSQVPQSVIDAVSGYLGRTNANSGGSFATSRATDAMLQAAHVAAADLVGTDDPDTVAFGPNMTTLTLSLARALARTWGPQDEVVVTRLDHDANVTPWILAAQDAGATVRHAGIRTDDCTLDLDDLAAQLGPRTRLVAVGCASNAVGTVQPVRRIADLAHRAGALVFLDAVHLAPHRILDVRAWDCDFLACSAYKFFGPHVGLLWGRRQWMEQLPVYKVRPAPDTLPGRFMTGTQNHEGIAGVLAAIEYLADLGRGRTGPGASRRERLVAAFGAIAEHERELSLHMLELVGARGELRLWGIADPRRLDERVATFGITHRGRGSGEVAERLAEQGIFVWHGNFYALPLTEALGLEPDGMVRIGLLHYNTHDEIDRLGRALAGLA